MSNEPKAGKGIDPEMLAAYIDNRLSPEQRAVVEAQLATDPESYATLVDTLKALDDEEITRLAVKEPLKPPVPFVPKVAKSRFRTLVIAGGGLAAAAALVLVVLLQSREGRGQDPLLSGLVEAVGNERVIESRVAGGFHPGPLKAVTRGPGRLENLSLVAAAGEVQRAVNADRNASTLHAWGVAQLMLGELDESVRTLDEALSEAPDDPRLLTSASGAYIARAQQLQRPQDWPRALELAILAVQKSPAANPEALFNKALAAQGLNLRSEAARYWAEYLEVEADPQWRQQAQEYLGRLQSSSELSWKSNRETVLASFAAGSVSAGHLSRFPQQIRELIEDVILPAWAAGVVRGDPGAAGELDRLQQLVSQLTAKTGDRLLLETVSGVEAWPADRRRALAEGLILYGQARALYENGSVQDSVKGFREAAAKLAPAGSPFAGWSELHIAIAAYYRGDYAGSFRDLTQLVQKSEAGTWSALGGRAHWMRGLIHQLRAEYRSSLAEYEDALARFDATRETDNASAIHNLIAEVLLYVGDEQSVWSHTVLALTAASPDMAFRRRHTMLVSAANKSTRLGLLEASLAIGNEASVVATEWQDPLALTEVSNYRARTLTRLGRVDAARAALTTANDSLLRVTDAAFRSRIQAEVLQTTVDVEAIADPRRGVEAATEALEFFTKTRSSLRVPRLLLARADARRRSGDLDGAYQDVVRSVDEFETERLRLPANELAKLGHSDAAWSAYTSLLDLEIARGAPCETLLAAANRARATTLRRAAVRAGDERPPLADGEVVFHYAFTGAGLQRIILRGDHCSAEQLAVSKGDVTALVARFWRSRERHDEAGSDAVGAALFAKVIGTNHQLVAAARRLTIVPDGPLHYLPFAALRDAGGKYLIESVALQVAPALTWGRSTPAVSPMRRVVVAGGDVADSGFAALPNATRERRLVALALKERASIIEQPAVSDMPALLETADVFHFAGHALSNPEFPLLSRLLIGGADNGGWLQARELEPLNLASTRLVFLSGCSTQSGRLFGGEGPASIARSFLAAGARQVVATHSDIPDASAAVFVERFYRAWLPDQDAATAVRRAAMDAIADRSTPSLDWQMWIAIGEPEWRM